MGIFGDRSLLPTSTATRKLSRVTQPTGIERHFASDDIIVSKTDLKGRITYANRTFLRIADFQEHELLGAPHSVVRHPDMPRCVFKLLWDVLATKKEVFAYVVNLARSGDHYWVFAHVTPSFGEDNEVVGYHSNRRTPKKSALEAVIPLYQTLLAEENKHSDRKAGMASSFQMFTDLLKEKDVSYDEFIFSL